MVGAADIYRIYFHGPAYQVARCRLARRRPRGRPDGGRPAARTTNPTGRTAARRAAPDRAVLPDRRHPRARNDRPLGAAAAGRRVSLFPVPDPVGRWRAVVTPRARWSRCRRRRGRRRRARSHRARGVRDDRPSRWCRRTTRSNRCGGPCDDEPRTHESLNRIARRRRRRAGAALDPRRARVPRRARPATFGSSPCTATTMPATCGSARRTRPMLVAGRRLDRRGGHRAGARRRPAVDAVWDGAGSVDAPARRSPAAAIASGSGASAPRRFSRRRDQTEDLRPRRRRRTATQAHRGARRRRWRWHRDDRRAVRAHGADRVGAAHAADWTGASGTKPDACSPAQPARARAR